MVRRRKAPAEKKKKKVNVKLIHAKNAGQVTGPYRVMARVIEQCHQRFLKYDTKIALAWQLDAKEDADGKVKVGTVRKRSDLERELLDFDFVISLNKTIWDGSDADQQEAILDDLLTRCEISLDKVGNAKIDEEGRVVYRIRKPDVVGFREVFARRGKYTSEIEAAFEALALAETTTRPLFRQIEDQEQDGVANGEAVPAAASDSVPVHDPRKKKKKLTEGRGTRSNKPK